MNVGKLINMGKSGRNGNGSKIDNHRPNKVVSAPASPKHLQSRRERLLKKTNADFAASLKDDLINDTIS